MNNHPKLSLDRRTFLKCTSYALAYLSLGSLGSCGSSSRLLVPSAILRFGIVTDVHYALREPAGSRYYHESLRKFISCIKSMNDHNVDFMIELGDFKDQGVVPGEQQTLQFLTTIEQVFAEFKGPRYHVLGNHDTDSLSKEQFSSITQNTGIEQGKTYYSYDVKGVHLVVLDACFTSDTTPYSKGNFDWTDSNIPPEELEWLERDLASTQYGTLIFVHQRLDGTGSVYVKNANTVRSMLKDSKKVLAVFQGHHHTGANTVVDKIPYYTLNAMVEGSGEENTSYAVVEVTEEGRVIVRGAGNAQSVELAATKLFPSI